jgi:hypothetical protein
MLFNPFFFPLLPDWPTLAAEKQLNFQYMTKKIVGTALLALVFAACSNSGERKTATTLAPAFPASTIPVTPAPVQQQQPFTSTPVQTSPNTNGVALNPAHGQPGHRCDIPEGAPLNSAVASTPTQSALPPTLNTAPVASPPQPANGNVKLNPAHGLPGHDCSIPVGQPLKS